jgi:chloramphenicol O-acetyltransferase type A
MIFHEHTKKLSFTFNSGFICMTTIEIMEKYTTIDLETWNRKPTFDFFKTFDIPFYNITANVDVTRLKEYCDESGHSFFLTSLFLSQKVMSQIDSLRLRLTENEVRLYERSRAGSTILMDNKTFAFCYFSMDTKLEEYVSYGEKAIQKLKSNASFQPRDGELNMVYYSIIPWISFTSFQHARRFEENDSVPRIVFGKYFKQGDSLQMPVSVEVHHSLVDGYHVGKYFETLQKEINNL